MIDLFSGAGGLSLGLSRAGFDPVAAIEINPHAAATYRELHGVDVIESDMRAVNLRRFRGEVQVVAGGPPCQPFLDRRAGVGERSQGSP